MEKYSFSSVKEIHDAGFGYSEFDLSHPRWELWRVNGKTIRVTPDSIKNVINCTTPKMKIAKISDIEKFATQEQPYK